MPKNQRGKITIEVEIMILYLRTTFAWGTARIQQGLMNLPKFMLAKTEVYVQNFKLSRTSINNILKKHGINGYRRKSKSWKFFRAKKPNELWQLDIKGPFRVNGKKFGFVDNSNKGSYVYKRKGILSNTPHIRPTRGVIIVRNKDAKKVISVLRHFKVKPQIFDITIKQSILH